jgi:hypothetical protein
MVSEQKVVIVGGCGHVGLPLGLVLASRTRTNGLPELTRDPGPRVPKKVAWSRYIIRLVG